MARDSWAYREVAVESVIDPRSGALFPSANLVRTNEAFGQAVFDLRALAAYLRANGAPSVGAIGMSLGGYTTALWASVDPTLAFANLEVGPTGLNLDIVYPTDLAPASVQG